ncbi:MAG: PhoH family protein [Methanobrevibacter sp.]|nr:PhoH family protein [Methanobrevibacter sp.]
MLDDDSITVKLVRGVYGSGKDYLMFSKSLELLDKGRFDKIVYIRPNVTVRDVPDIGFLPSGVYDKLSWTLGPLFDKAGGEEGVR